MLEDVLGAYETEEEAFGDDGDEDELEEEENGDADENDVDDDGGGEDVDADDEDNKIIAQGETVRRAHSSSKCDG